MSKVELPISFKVKSIPAITEDEYIEIEGYANTTDIDRVRDVVLPEAWMKGGLDNYLKNPIILAYHDMSKPIGSMVDYSVNDKGLKIVAKIFKSAGNIFNLVKEGVLKTFSVQFAIKDADYNPEADVFVIKDLELYEISVVSVPANADSVFEVKKSYSTEEYEILKSRYLSKQKEVNTSGSSGIVLDNNEGDNMPQDKAALEAELREKIKKEIEEEARKKAELESLVKSVVKEEKDEISTTITTVKDQVETIREEVEKKLNDETSSLSAAIEAIKKELSDYTDEVKAALGSKITFEDRNVGTAGISEKEIDTAVMVSKILNRPIADTNYGKTIIQKSDGAHQTGMNDRDWEAGFSTRLFNDVRQALVVENLFTSINMPSVTLDIPLNPEAGYGTWVTNADFGSVNSSGTSTTHGLQDGKLTAYKLATKENLSYEEEDDILISLVPIIRDAAVRRMARSSDKALLVGDLGISAGTGEGIYPFNGLATIGIDDNRTIIIGGTVASPTKVTVADMQALRRLLGVQGHNPNDVVYIVSHTVYFDLLEDPDFRTMDKVGASATILTGQLGMLAGSPVVVSGEFPAPAVNAPAAVCVNMSNYLKGDYKGLTVERERSVSTQSNLLVVTRRFGMLELFPAQPTVATLVNPAL